MDLEEILGFAALAFIGVLVIESVNNTGDVSVSVPDTGQDFSPTDSVVSVDMSKPGKLMQFAEAIFNFEGGKPGNLNVRNNNPGNLKFAGQPGATMGSGGFAVFSSINDGWAALYAQLNKTISEFPQLNLNQFFARYLGQQDFFSPMKTDQGDPFAYANFAAAKLGVNATDTLSTIFGG